MTSAHCIHHSLPLMQTQSYQFTEVYYLFQIAVAAAGCGDLVVPPVSLAHSLEEGSVLHPDVTWKGTAGRVKLPVVSLPLKNDTSK